MTDALTHRGPDGEGFYHDNHIALGHRRLSIIDVEGGRQPISNEDDTLKLVCNGEIYNSPDLRKDLIRRGHKFKTATDVEVILHLYEEFGCDCVNHLRGMFAFAIWDSKDSTLFLARDHMGQKPLFYFSEGGRFLFSSEVKGILASANVAPEPDLEALWHYISLRYLPADLSLFKGIKKLPAATVLRLKDGSIRTQKYWEPSFLDKSVSSEAQLIGDLDELLKETVSMHTLSDVPVGAFLSGGIDSSTVAALMALQSSSPVPVFSIGVEEQGFNEIPYARMVATQYGMEIHEEIVKADLIHLIPEMVYFMEEPSDPFGMGVYLASRLARRHVKVSLSGDGGDENFAGYDRYAGQRIVDWYCILPAGIRRVLMRRLIGLIPESFSYKSLAQKATWVNEMSFYSHGERYAHSLSFLRFVPDAKNALYTASARDQVKDDDSAGHILRYFDAANVDDLVDRMLFTDLMTRMPDHLLALGDRMSMAHSLECRPTLVDYKLVEFAATVPGRLKLHRGELKYLLKKVATKHLPQDLINRRKQGFTFPLGHWMREELSGFISNLFAQSRFVEHGIFELSYMNNLLAEHLSGAVDHSYRLWILINLEFWYRIHLEGESVESMREMTDELVHA